jgi:putative ATPase
MNEENSPYVPLPERMRPREIDEIVGQEHLLGPGRYLRTALERGRAFSVIFWGPPGSGKTTIAKIMGEKAGLPFRTFSAVTSGIKELREIIDEAREERLRTGRSTVLFVDEIHRFNKAQQDAFLPHVESGLIILVGATTENPSFEVIGPLLSRARVMILRPMDREGIKTILERALKDSERGLGRLGLTVAPEALEHLIDTSHGDARVALANLEAASQMAVKTDKGLFLDLAAAEEALSRKALPYDKAGEEHYNLISAFHKSLRGSDPQAGIYWLYRMLEAGEDPLFIARRMIRFASEDVGLADPAALQVAMAAFDAWEKVGPPEAGLALMEAAVYLAAAPKSNALYLAEKAVKEEIERSGPLQVPLHITNAPTSLMRGAGYGRGYLYPHNYRGAWVAQKYLPSEIEGRVFYRPTPRGFEREISTRLEDLKKKMAVQD